jgi:pimeloyl-ACP methyl ester carboxylesterase
MNPSTAKRSAVTLLTSAFVAMMMIRSAESLQTHGSADALTSSILNDALSVHYHSATVDGIRIFYREAGDPHLPTVLLLHGFSSSSHMFRDLMPLLAHRFHLIAPDYPGFGYSDAPSATVFEPTFSNLETIIEHFVSQIGLQSFILYMQDFGGPVGFRMAVRHPDWIHGLIIQNANAYREGLVPLPTTDTPSPPGAVRQSTSSRVVSPDFIRQLYQSGARNPSALNPDSWTVDSAVLENPEAKRIQAALIDNYVTNIQLYPEWQAYLRQRQPRTLVAWGKSDKGFSPAGAESYRRDVNDITVKYFETGHFALEEDASGVALAIVQSFSTKGPRGPAADR